MDYFNDEYMKKANIKKMAMEESTFSKFYEYWRTQLFERVMRLFVWENTGSVKPKEIEQRLILRGHCGVCQYKGELTAFYGSFYGVTKYYDEYTNYMVSSPKYSGKKTIDKDIIIIDNNATRSPVYPLIHHYAMLLAHNEVSLIDAMVDIRDASGKPIAENELQRQSIINYYGKRFNGQFDIIMDPAFAGVKFDASGSGTGGAASVTSLLVARKDILQAFYSDIGIRSAFEKKSNTVASEVQADTALLLLNLSDMLAMREEAAEKINNLFGTNWSVHIAKEIDYKAENELEVEANENSEGNI